MPNEVQWQRKYIVQLQKEGGYGKKWASSFSVGVPDLITVLPGMGFVAMEAKLEKAWDINTQRTISLTPKQIEELAKMRDAGGLAFVLLFIQQAQRETYLGIFAPPPNKLGSALRIDRNTALEDSFRWETKGERSLISWSCDRINKLL